MLTHIGTNIIETDRLILRRFQYTDDEAMLKYWIADEKIQSLYSEPTYTTKEAVKELLDKYIGSEFQCRGYATEATKAVITYGFDKMNLHKVQICTKTINAPSKRVIEKCGFTYEGTLRDYFYMNEEYVGRLYFSMLRNEYENMKWNN